MPNWCSTNYAISGPDVKVLHDNIVKAQESAKIETDFGADWLGHLIDYCGLNYKNYYCRGSISAMVLDENQLLIDTETAWAPQHDAIIVMRDRFAPNADILYTSIEPGSEIYISNDPDSYGKYLIDIWENSGLPEPLNGLDYEFYSNRELREILKECFGMSHLSTPKLIEEAHTRWSDNLSIHKIEQVEL